MSTFEINQYGRWFALSDQLGYMLHDEPQLADLGARIAHLPAPSKKPPKQWLPWASTADVSLHIPPSTEALPRLFHFAAHAVHAATGERFPVRIDKDAINFISKFFPPLQRDLTLGPVFNPQRTLDEDPIFVPLAVAGTVPTAPLVPVPPPPATVAAVAALPVPAIQEALCARMSLANVLQASQLELHERLLTAAAGSGFHARRAIVNAWNAFAPAERGMLPSVSKLVQAPTSESLRTTLHGSPGAAADAAAADMGTGGATAAVAAGATASRDPATIPPGLSPADAYYLVSCEPEQHPLTVYTQCRSFCLCAVQGDLDHRRCSLSFTKHL